MTVDAYLERIGVDPEEIGVPDRPARERLQRAHVTTVPFETLAITGDPYGNREGEGVVLTVSHLYDKIVERRRGGYCFELNGLFYWLLSELGYDVDRVAARIVSDGGTRIPANHHALVVHIDQPFVVDVGTGPPRIRVPVPTDGTRRADECGIEWRVLESDRPDVRYRTEYRKPKESDWTPRYVFNDVPRSLRYFAATNNFLQSAPESPFTGEPVVSLSTRTGHRTLSDETLTEATNSGDRERTVTGNAWYTTLEQVFGLRYGPK